MTPRSLQHPEPAREDEALPPELLRIIQGLARMNARRDYAAHQAQAGGPLRGQGAEPR